MTNRNIIDFIILLNFNNLSKFKTKVKINLNQI